MGPGFLVPQHLSEGSENHFVLKQPFVIPLLEYSCVAASNQNRTTRTGFLCASSQEGANGFQLLRQSRVSIARRNPPVTDDHNLSNPSERYRTRLGDTELGPSMTPFKHISRFTDTMQCSKKKKVHETPAFGCTEHLTGYTFAEASRW